MLFPTSITIVITYGILFFLNEEKSLHPSLPLLKSLLEKNYNLKGQERILV